MRGSRTESEHLYTYCRRCRDWICRGFTPHSPHFFIATIRSDFARDRFSRKIAHANDFSIQRINQTMLRGFLRSEQSRKIAVTIIFAQVIGAIC